MSSYRSLRVVGALLGITAVACDLPQAPSAASWIPDADLKKGGNGGSGGAPVVDELDTWDPTRWLPGDHPLGRGAFDPANVSHSGGVLYMTLPPGGYDGAEIRSAERVRYRGVEARIRTPRAPGSISALFLYEFVLRRNDEIDIEIFNDGSRQVLFTTWVAGRMTNNTTHELPFDPADAFHDYRIEWSRRNVRFLVDGVVMEEFTSGVPRDAMFVMSNTWWPTSLSGPPLTATAVHEIDRIVY